MGDRVIAVAEIGPALCAAMGLDANTVRRIAFDWNPQGPALVTVEQYITGDRGQAVTRVFEAFEWREVAP